MKSTFALIAGATLVTCGLATVAVAVAVFWGIEIPLIAWLNILCLAALPWLLAVLIDDIKGQKGRSGNFTKRRGATMSRSRVETAAARVWTWKMPAVTVMIEWPQNGYAAMAAV